MPVRTLHFLPRRLSAPFPRRARQSAFSIRASADCRCCVPCAPRCRTNRSSTSRIRFTRPTANATTTSSSTGRWRSANGSSRAARRRWWSHATRRPRSPSRSCASGCAIPLIGVEPGMKPAALVVEDAGRRRAGDRRHLAQPALPGAARALRRRLPLSSASRATGSCRRSSAAMPPRPNCVALLRELISSRCSTPAPIRSCSVARTTLFSTQRSARSSGDRLTDRRYEHRDRAATRTRSSTRTVCASVSGQRDRLPRFYSTADGAHPSDNWQRPFWDRDAGSSTL